MSLLTSLISILATFTILWTDYIGIAFADEVETLHLINIPRFEYREYRGIKLANGLQVLLIRDQKINKSAAAMVVAAGTLNDEREHPGIANLVRYLLLTRCLRYPNKFEFMEYLEERGGKLGSKYMTSDAEHKHLYSFEVNNDFLELTLNRFAQHFLDPLFKGVDKDALKEALKGYSVSHDRTMSKDAMRVAQVLKSISQQDHPYNNLTYGTVRMLNEYARLGVDPIDEKLMDFFHKWYSANRMRLVVMSSANLNAMQEIVRAAFSNIRYDDREKLMFSFNEHPWKSDQLTHKLCIVPVEKNPVREIRLSFPVPDVLKQYKISPQKYAQLFFNHTEPGTLGYILPHRGLCKPKSVRAEYHVQAGIGFFTITMEPTERGVADVNSVLELTFQSINLLRNEGIVKWLYDEEKQIDVLNFTVKGDRFQIVHNMASAMHDYPLEDVISYQFVCDPWEAEPIHCALIGPKKMSAITYFCSGSIAVVDKSCEGADELMRIEPWYKTKYQIERIPPSTLKKWESAAGSSSEFQMPPPSEFIPETMDVDRTNQEENVPHHPFVIHKSSLSRFWYRRDDDIPAVDVEVDLVSSIMHLHPMNGTLMEIFIRMMVLALEKYEYSAHRTARFWSVTQTRTGFQIKVKSVNDKSDLLMEKIFSIFQNFREVFSEKKCSNKPRKSGVKKYQSTSKNPVESGVFYIVHILNSGGWTPDDFSVKEDSFQYQNIGKFVPRLLSRIHIQGLIYGNVARHKAERMVNIIEKYFELTSRMILPQQLLNVYGRFVQMDSGKNFVYHTSSDGPKHLYHAYFQLGDGINSPDNIRLLSIGDVLLQIIGKACQKILPPRDTGTSLCGIDSVKNVHGFVITITSTMDPDRADRRAEQFLEMMRDKLRNFSITEFVELRNNIVLHRAIESDTRQERVSMYWAGISQRDHNFKKSWTEFRELHNIGLGQVIVFFEEILAKESPKRRKLTAYVYSNALMQNAPENSPSAEDKNSAELKSTEIEDIITFKNSSSLQPILLPITNLLPQRKLF